ncbi:hypothetical protein [Ruthenibacterium lactatiformans]|uniref:hypothetical protein n=1 Tax=Ruthenibacterium lactatiformans TaxID=1550024 RepID=UPI00210A31A3|nr:hypothetical protein [Ruthenibacterium lactatiformans]MCQ5087192.1 hypothetical protein [Ruthenibacterium lactatiformans]
MEKLTEYVDGKYIRIKGTKSLYPKNERDGAPLSNAIARLAAYEETGLEPEELAQAKKKGRLVVLPCDVGDKLYDVTLGEVREKIVISLSMLLSKSVNHLVIHAENFRNAVTSYELQDIGKTVFLTREAAEATLDAMRGENNA